MKLLHVLIKFWLQVFKLCVCYLNWIYFTRLNRVGKTQGKKNFQVYSGIQEAFEPSSTINITVLYFHFINVFHCTHPIAIVVTMIINTCYHPHLTKHNIMKFSYLCGITEKDFLALLNKLTQQAVKNHPLLPGILLVFNYCVYFQVNPPHPSIIQGAGSGRAPCCRCK